MKETNNLQNDWLALNILNENVTIEDMAANGLNSMNTGIKPKEEYLKSNDIQEIFKNDSGNFDERKFDETYNQAMQSYLVFSQIDQKQWIEDNYAVNPYDPARTPDKKVKQNKYEVINVPNPFETSLGFHEGGEGIRTLSIAELAQKNPYYDTEKGEFSDKSPNDLGALGYLGKDALVLAQYDEDTLETLEDGTIIQHKKGDYKLNPDGKYYYETANGKETYGKQVLGAFDILTVDESAWNKVDIFDTDNIKTSPVKSIARAIAINLPYVIPGVGEYYALASAASFLAESMPAIIKTFNSIIDGDYDPSKWLNDYENWSKKVFNTTKSENSRTHFFSFENIMDIAASSGSQLFQQRAVANIPKILGFDKRLEEKVGILKSKAFDEAVKSNLITRQDVNEALRMANAGKRMSPRIETIIDSMPEYKQAYDVYKKYMKQSEALSRAYLTITSAANVYGDAINDGFDRRTAGLISLGVYLGYDAFFRTDYMRRFLRSGIDLEEEGKMLRQAVYQNLSARGKDIFGEIAKEKGALGVLKESKNIFKKAWDDIHKGGREYFFLSGVNESVEETMEELMMDASKAIFGNGLNAIREQLGYETKGYFDYAKSNPLKRYLQSAIGGFIGGEIFGLESAWRSRNGSTGWNDMLNNRPELGRTILKYVNAGKKDDIINLANSFRGTAFASKSLSYHERNDDGSYVATNKENESQNDYVIDSFISYVENLDKLLEQEGMKYDPENEQYKDVYRSLTALTLSERLFGADSKYTDVVSSNISKLQVELYDVQSKILEAERSENKNEKELELLKYEFDLIKKRINDLRTGLDENVFGMIFASSNPSVFGDRSHVNINAFTKNKYHLDYDKINDSGIKDLISKKYEQYISSGEAQHDSWLAYITYKNVQEKITEVFKIDSSTNKPWIDLSKIAQNSIDPASNGILTLSGFTEPGQQVKYNDIVAAVKANNTKIGLLKVLEKNAEAYLDDNENFVLDGDGNIVDPENAIHSLNTEWGYTIDQIKEKIKELISLKSFGESVTELSQEEILSIANLIAIFMSSTGKSYIPSFIGYNIVNESVYRNFLENRRSPEISDNSYYKYFLDSIQILRNSYRNSFINALGEDKWSDDIYNSIGLGKDIGKADLKIEWNIDNIDEEGFGYDTVSVISNISNLFKELNFGDLSLIDTFWEYLINDVSTFSLEPTDVALFKKIKNNLESLKSYINGATDYKRNTYNLMGANSIINQFRTDSNSIEPKLLTMSENTKVLFEYAINLMSDKIDKIIDTAEKNSVNENNREKKLGLVIKTENLEALSKVYSVLKDVYDDFPDIEPVKSNDVSNDSELEAEDIRLENILIRYEHKLYEWFSGKSTEVKKDFITKLQSVFPRYAEEASFLSLNKEENSLGNYNEDTRFYWYTLSNCICDPSIFYETLKDSVNNDEIKKAPYYSQESIVKNAFLFIFGNQTDLDIILERSQEALGENFGLVALGSNILRFSAGNGVGKTAAIIPMIRTLIEKRNSLNGNKNRFLYISTTERAINKLSSESSEKSTITSFLESLNRYITVYDSNDKKIESGTLLDKLISMEKYNDDETLVLDYQYIKGKKSGVLVNAAVKNLLNNKTIIIDEGTYIDTRIYGLLSYINQRYRLNLKIITTGDSLQGGLPQNFTGVLSMLAPSLYESKRVTTNVGKHNNNQLRNYVLKGENSIQFNYSVNSKGEFNGEDFVGLMTISDDAKIQTFINSHKNSYILIYGQTSNLNGEKILKANTIKAIQGDEFDYIIIKASDLKGLNRKEINTILSRYKNGAIIINDSSTFRDDNGTTFTTNNINWDDVISIGVENEENIKKYINYRKKTLNSLTIPASNIEIRAEEQIPVLEAIVESIKEEAIEDAEIVSEQPTEPVYVNEEVNEGPKINVELEVYEKRKQLTDRLVDIMNKISLDESLSELFIDKITSILKVIDDADINKLNEISNVLDKIQRSISWVETNTAKEESIKVVTNDYLESIVPDQGVIVHSIPFDDAKKYKLRMYSFYNRLGGDIREDLYTPSGNHMNEDFNIFYNFTDDDPVDIYSKEFIYAQTSLNIERNILLYNLAHPESKKPLKKMNEGRYLIKLSKFDPFADSLFDKGNEDKYKLLKDGDVFRRLVYRDDDGKEITLLVFPSERTIKSHSKDNIGLIKYINNLNLGDNEDSAYYELNEKYIRFRESDRPIYFEEYNPKLRSNITWHQFEPFKLDGQYSWVRYTNPMIFGTGYFSSPIYNEKSIVDIWNELDEMYWKASTLFDSIQNPNIENPFKYKNGNTIKCPRLVKNKNEENSFAPIIFAYLNTGENIPILKASGMYINTLKAHYDSMKKLIEYAEGEKNVGEKLDPMEFMKASSIRYDVIPLSIARNIKKSDELLKVFTNFVSDLNSGEKVRSSIINVFNSLLNVYHKRLFDQNAEMQDEYIATLDPLFKRLEDELFITKAEHNDLSKKIFDLTEKINSKTGFAESFEISGKTVKVEDLIKIAFETLYNKQGLLKPQFARIAKNRNLIKGKIKINGKMVSVNSIPLLYPVLLNPLDVQNFQKGAAEAFPINMKKEGENDRYVFHGPYVLERGWTFMEYDIPIVNNKENYNEVIKKISLHDKVSDKPKVVMEREIVPVVNTIKLESERNKDRENEYEELSDFYDFLDWVDDNQDKLGYNASTLLSAIEQRLTNSDGTRYTLNNLDDILGNLGSLKDLYESLKEIGIDLENLDIPDDFDYSADDIIRSAWEYKNEVKC